MDAIDSVNTHQHNHHIWSVVCEQWFALLLIKPPEFRSNWCINPHTWIQTHIYLYELKDTTHTVYEITQCHSQLIPHDTNTSGRQADFTAFKSLSGWENTTHKPWLLLWVLAKKKHINSTCLFQGRGCVKSKFCIAYTRYYSTACWVVRGGCRIGTMVHMRSCIETHKYKTLRRCAVLLFVFMQCDTLILLL